jgi:polysaccharide export outer membrane protein
MKYINHLITITLGLIILTGCTINSNRMLRTPKNYDFDQIEEKLNEIEYKIDINDQITFQLYTNNGFQLIDMFSESGNNQQSQRMMMNGQNQGLFYFVRQDSLVELPIIGDINLVGKTTREAELYLEEIFSEFYVDPYIILRVNSKRVFLFSGSTGGEASVVPLTYNNMSLFEVLAQSGGIGKNNSSKKIKIIRKTKDGIKIFNADLSTIEGINEGNMIMQSDDIIYITPNINLIPELLEDINPILSFFSTISLILFSLNQLSL